MLDIKWIRENPQALDEALKKRGADPESAKLLALVPVVLWGPSQRHGHSIARVLLQGLVLEGQRNAAVECRVEAAHAVVAGPQRGRRAYNYSSEPCEVDWTSMA